MSGDGNDGVGDGNVVVGNVTESTLGSALDVLTAGRAPVILFPNEEEVEPGVDEVKPMLKFPSVASLVAGMLARKSG